MSSNRSGHSVVGYVPDPAETAATRSIRTVNSLCCASPVCEMANHTGRTTMLRSMGEAKARCVIPAPAPASRDVGGPKVNQIPDVRTENLMGEADIGRDLLRDKGSPRP